MKKSVLTSCWGYLAALSGGLVVFIMLQNTYLAAFPHHSTIFLRAKLNSIHTFGERATELIFLVAKIKPSLVLRPEGYLHPLCGMNVHFALT